MFTKLNLPDGTIKLSTLGQPGAGTSYTIDGNAYTVSAVRADEDNGTVEADLLAVVPVVATP